MLGLRSRPSSRSLKEAIDLLNAVGGDKAKAKILEEIKQAQDQYEAVVAKANEDRRAAQQAKVEANVVIEKARKMLIEAEEKGEAVVRESDEAERRHAREIDQLNARQHSLENHQRDFDAKVKRVNAELDVRQRSLGNVERMKRQAEALMAEAHALKDSYRSKLARLVAIAEEEPPT